MDNDLFKKDEPSKEDSLDTNPPTNEAGTQTIHTPDVENASNTHTRIEPMGSQDPAHSRADVNPNDTKPNQKFRDSIEERMKMTGDTIPVLTGAQLDEQFGTTFANATSSGARLSGSPVGGVAVGLNNKDLIDPTADNRRRVDDVGLRPPLHTYDDNSVDGPETRDFFKGSRPETS